MARSNHSSSSLSVLRLLRSLILLPVIIFAALVMAAFGRTELLDSIKSTFRRWHILRPTTQEERVNNLLFYVSWHRRLLGLKWYTFLYYALRRRAGDRHPMGFFLKNKLDEVMAAFPSGFERLAAQDDIGMVIGATSLIDEL